MIAAALHQLSAKEAKRFPREYNNAATYPSFSGDADGDDVVSLEVHVRQVEEVFATNGVTESRKLDLGGQTFTGGARLNFGRYRRLPETPGQPKSWSAAVEYLRIHLFGKESGVSQHVARDKVLSLRYCGTKHPLSFFEQFQTYVQMAGEFIPPNMVRDYFVKAMPEEFSRAVPYTVRDLDKAYECVLDAWNLRQWRATSAGSKTVGVNPVGGVPSGDTDVESDMEIEGSRKPTTTGGGSGSSSPSKRKKGSGERTDKYVRDKGGNKRLKNRSPIDIPPEFQGVVAAIERSNQATREYVRKQVGSFQGQGRNRTGGGGIPQPQWKQRNATGQQWNKYRPRSDANQERSDESCCPLHRVPATAETVCYAGCPAGKGHYADHCPNPADPERQQRIKDARWRQFRQQHPNA